MSNFDQPFGSYGSTMGPQFEALVQARAQQEEMEKALTTGQGIVQPGDTGAAALRDQFLDKNLITQVSFDSDDAAFMKDIPKRDIGSTTFEYSEMTAYGGSGDAFVGETGFDGNFNVTGADDSFVRLLRTTKYMATYRQVGKVAQLVNNIQNPVMAAQMGATRELVGKTNQALYFASSAKNALQFDGIAHQITDWVDRVPSDCPVLYDAGGLPIDKDMMADITQVNANLYGNATEFRCSNQTYTDTQKTLFPIARYTEGSTDRTFGTNRDVFNSPFNDIKFKPDKMLRPNRPLMADGPAVSGKPRTSSTVDAGSLTCNANPVTASAVAAGTGYFWQRANKNTDATTMGNAPALPTQGGVTVSHLANGGYLYAVAPVYFGKEGLPFVVGATNAGDATTGGGATAVTVATNTPIVQINIDTTQITGLGTAIPRSAVYFRVYRAPAGSTTLASFDWLMDIACPVAGAARGYDNGYQIPGSDTGFLMTRQKNGVDAYFLGQFLPIYRTALPIAALANQYAWLWFGTPVVYTGRHHVIVRNIGRYTGS